MQCAIPFQHSAPTRLLELTGDMVRLRHTAGLSSVPQYMTISHCWGGLELYKLTRKNMDCMQARIPEEKLSQTFRDAICINRKLGMNYLWIDTLCIIQDDAREWQQEASRMSDVYRGATLGLAASSAPDGNAGCFADRNNVAFECVQGVKIQATERHRLTVFPFSIYENAVSETPLAQRSWALQVRFLAPRTVHFSHSQLF